ncbi:hypothetical protein GCM10023203_37900 [Actinomycetospora straminea]|uniref:Uncharacterized protein n=1 Tax=Actinomycetospora straminea TaxID=663607 RepID=A0ABP9ELY8_9PSEU
MAGPDGNRNAATVDVVPKSIPRTQPDMNHERRHRSSASHCTMWAANYLQPQAHPPSQISNPASGSVRPRGLVPHSDMTVSTIFRVVAHDVHGDGVTVAPPVRELWALYRSWSGTPARRAASCTITDIACPGNPPADVASSRARAKHQPFLGLAARTARSRPIRALAQVVRLVRLVGRNESNEPGKIGGSCSSVGLNWSAGLRNCL